MLTESFLIEAMPTSVERTSPRQGTTFEYVYDFGDEWKLGCPGGKAGGVPGYELLLKPSPIQAPQATRSPGLGGKEDYDPERFDLEETNEQLKRIEVLAETIGSSGFPVGLRRVPSRS